MMSTNLTENTNFWACLNRWHKVVQNMLRQGRAPRGVSDEVYIQLHRELLGYVQDPSLDQSIPTGQMRQALHHCVRPWVNLESLSRCDKRILRMLEQEIREARSNLMPRHYWRRQFMARLIAATMLLVVAGVCFGMYSVGDERAMRIFARLESSWQYVDGARAQLWIGAAQSSVNQRLIALAGAMVAVGIFFLRDPKRS